MGAGKKPHHDILLMLKDGVISNVLRRNWEEGRNGLGEPVDYALCFNQLDAAKTVVWWCLMFQLTVLLITCFVSWSNRQLLFGLSISLITPFFALLWLSTHLFFVGSLFPVVCSRFLKDYLTLHLVLHMAPSDTANKSDHELKELALNTIQTLQGHPERLVELEEAEKILDIFQLL